MVPSRCSATAHHAIKPSLAATGHGQSGGPLDHGGAEHRAFFWSRQACLFTIYHPLQDMASLEGRWIAAALIPAALITVLFFFDHNVSAQLAQQVGVDPCRSTICVASCMFQAIAVIAK